MTTNLQSAPCADYDITAHTLVTNPVTGEDSYTGEVPVSLGGETIGDMVSAFCHDAGVFYGGRYEVKDVRGSSEHIVVIVTGSRLVFDSHGRDFYDDTIIKIDALARS